MNNNHKCKICGNLMNNCICKKSKNKKVLNDFIHYCITHPEQRFWQALRNWSSFGAIYGGSSGQEKLELQDTFYFEGKDK